MNDFYSLPQDQEINNNSATLFSDKSIPKWAHASIICFILIFFGFLAFYVLPQGQKSFYDKEEKLSLERDQMQKQKIEILKAKETLLQLHHQFLNQNLHIIEQSTTKFTQQKLQNQKIQESLKTLEIKLQTNKNNSIERKQLMKSKEELLQKKGQYLREEAKFTDLRLAVQSAKEQIFELQEQIKKLKYAEKKGATAVFTSCNRFDFLERSLQSFFKYNDYPLDKVIVVQDWAVLPETPDIMSKFPNITWLILGKRMGQLKAIDEAYKLVQTEYIFHSEDDWTFLDFGLIEKSIAFMEKHPNVVNYYSRWQTDEYDPKTSIVNLDWFWGFSLGPGMKKMRDYTILPGGYVGVTHNRTYGWISDKEETYLSNYYKKLGFRTAQPQYNYTFHIGGSKSRHGES